MEDKVNDEMDLDRRLNQGKIFETVVSIVASHGSEMEPGDDQYTKIVQALGNNALARVLEWQDRALQHLGTLPPEERRMIVEKHRKLTWLGSDTVTDINEFRKR